MPAVGGTTSASPALSLRTTYTNPLLSQVTAGALVRASHYNLLKDFIDSVGVHTHTLTDYSRIAEFGNLGVTNSTTDTTSIVPGFSYVPYYVGAGDVVTAAYYAELRNRVELVRSHNHSWDDLTS